MMNSKIGSPQRGVVLIIALIMLVIISLFAVTSLRNAASSESVAGNVRTTELAMQAAEIALHHCESAALNEVTVAAGGTPTFTSTFVASNILPASTTTTAQWQSLSAWDSTPSVAYILPLQSVNQLGMTVTYKRPPECMVEPLRVMLTSTGAISTTASFVITARGFGPEVAAASSTNARPAGSEVWLQSHIELQ